MRTAEHYRDQMLQLQPPGLALPIDPESTWAQLLEALGVEYTRVESRLQDLVDEADPRTADELLPDWERVAGLPDECVGTGGLIEERRDAVRQKLTARGGQSPSYFVELAASLGFTITIEEYSTHTVGDDVSQPLHGDAWSFAWAVQAPEDTVRELTVQDDVGQPLADWGNDALECLISRYAPAHTVVLFEYGAT